MESTLTQETIQKIITWIESSADFVKGQWPDFVEQYMRAALIRTWLNTSVLLIAIFVSTIIMLYCVNFIWKFEGKSYDIPMHAQVGAFVPIIVILSAFGGLLQEIHTLINIYIAPKVYILYHLKDFIK